MPELPEVETTLRGITPHIAAKTVTDVVVRQARLRYPVPANLRQILKGEKLLDIERRAKYLLLRFRQGVLIIHLGMSGSLRIIDPKLVTET
ncbi:MAG: DNA-formamidopyrimidine glycosylase, partial [Gammaproteobacteria bacterium]|nr:DNA-formamidopyrimidine glycosylase [Gammaproteobacteria bacterium]